MSNNFIFLWNVFLKSLFFCFLNFNLIFSNNCNDSSAINYIQNSSSNDECVYVANIPSFTSDEDTIAQKDLNQYIQGNPNFFNNLLFNVNCLNIAGIVDNSCEVVDNQLFVSLEENFDEQTGFFNIIITYEDDSSNIFQPKIDPCSVVVNPINDYPIITTDNINLEAVNGNMFELYIEVDDPDDYSFIFNLDNEPPGMVLESYATTSIISYVPDELDSFSFEVTASDNQGLSDSKTYNVLIVEENNQLPIIDFSNTNFTIDEDSILTINFTVNDDDNFNQDDLSIIAVYSRGSIVNEYHFASGNGANYVATFPVRPNWNGLFEVKFIANDNVSYSTETIEVYVNPVNDNPYITGYQNINFNEGSNTNITMFISDIDSDSFLNETPFNFADMSFEITPEESNPNIFSDIIGGGSGSSFSEINFSTEDLDWYGQESFTITLNDGLSGSINQSFLVSVINVNDAPTIGFIDNQTINEDTVLDLIIDIDDIDSEILTLSGSSDFLIFDFNGNNMQITPSKHYNGDNLDVQITVSDGSLESNTNFSLSILPVDDYPFVGDINFNLEEDNQVEINLNGSLELCSDEVLNNSNGSITCDCENLDSGACDIEDEILSFQIYDFPSSGDIELNNNIVSYSPDLNFTGVDQFTYEVCDQSALCSIGNVNLNISAINDPPIAEDKSFEINEDQIDYQIILDATDAETNNLNFNIINEPGFGTYILEQNIFIYSPSLNYFGLDSFVFNVSDGENTIEVEYTINILPVNDAPILVELDDVTFDEDSQTTIFIDASDVDDENLVLSVTDGIKIFPEIGDLQLFGFPITFTSLENFNGFEEFTVTVSDDEGLSSEKNFRVNVIPVNDKPVAENSDFTINEDESISIELIGTDIDQDDLTYIIVAEPEKGLIEVENNIVTYESSNHFNGIETFEFKVSDGNLESDTALISVNVSPVNDRPMAKRIIESIGEDCSLDIDVNSNINLCTEEILDGVKCDCNSDLFLSGVCDIESSNLTYQVINQPENGEVVFNGSIATYTPDLDYISEEGKPDVFRYKVCDDELCSFDDDSEILSDGICIDDNQCPFVEVTVGKLNDTPAVNCINDDCSNPLFLSDYYYLMYEDCLDYDNFATSETENLEDCNSLEGISISKLRTFNLEISNICDENSDSVLWYDTDCENSENQNEFSYGIAVDIQSNLNNNESKGVWKYKLKGENTFNSFGVDIGCNYKLLDQEDEIKFFPNNDYFSVNNEFPSFSFYPWDKTEDADDEDLCIELLNSRDQPCGGASAYSSQLIELKWEVIAVNDTPRLDTLGDLIEDNSLEEFCDIENDDDCNENQDYKVQINAYDLKDPQDDLYFYISSQTISNNENQSLFKKINFDNNLFINESLVNPGLIFNEEIITNNLLKLDLTNYANGTAKIKVGISDRENIDEGLFVVDSFDVKINPVNNRISSYSIVENISAYDDYQNESMFVNINEQFSIKYPNYQYNEVDLNINDINDANFSDIRNYMISNPYKMNDIYFKWNRTTENGYYLDFDIDPLLNDEPYELYYRLELLDHENNVYVLKDSIPDSSFPGLEYAYTNIKFSSGPFKNYIDGEIYNAQTDLKARIDTTGLTQYNWRIIAENYEQGEILEDYDFYNTATALSGNSYLINTHIPTLNFDFVLNDIYNNYFDLYLSPIPSTFNGENNYYNLNFNENSEIYLNYSNDGVSPNEINTLSMLTLNDDQDSNLNYQNIYHTYDDFNELGKMTWFVPISNNVGTVNIFAKDVYYESILPNTYNSIDSNSGSFNIQFFTNENINILLQENSRKSMSFNFDLVSDILKINSNKNNINYDIKLSYNIENLTNNDISFAKIIDNEIIPIPSFVENYKLVAYVSEFESYVVIQLDNSNFEDEIPSDINIISCYPNPFNPSTTIRFTLDSSNDFNIKIFNLSGQEVFTKNNIPSNLGLNEYTWNGMNDKGNSLTSGIYFITIEIDNRILMEKVTLLK
ncbi:MAG: hypothetical protein CMG39_05995 [Candidatus Marinimicrobia bacterium]|nr:hypothetical protein [Candidatus Neomarinimicrobiota bacterium]